jgi:hypothetical protein
MIMAIDKNRDHHDNPPPGPADRTSRQGERDLPKDRRPQTDTISRQEYARAVLERHRNQAPTSRPDGFEVKLLHVDRPDEQQQECFGGQVEEAIKKVPEILSRNDQHDQRIGVPANPHRPEADSAQQHPVADLVLPAAALVAVASGRVALRLPKDKGHEAGHDSQSRPGRDAKGVPHT